MHSNLSIKFWTEDEFSAGQEKWQELLKNSDTDLLFSSWSWLYNWWDIWGRNQGSELMILSVYEGAELVGIAPLHKSKTRILANLIKVEALEFLGSMYYGNSGIRTEYRQFIVRKGYEESVVSYLMEYIFNEIEWNEIIFSDLISGSKTSDLFKKKAKRNHCYSRLDKVGSTYLVNCSGEFSDYLSSLTSSTRLKLFNRRKVLEKHGEVTFKNSKIVEMNELFDAINEFHEVRWKSPCFDSNSRKFILSLLNQFKRGDRTYCSQLLVGEEVLSIVINIEVAGKIYNIQLGFKDGYDKKISMGTLHLGYALEQTFLEDDLSSFDFLAGDGKNSNYKTKISSPFRLLESIQIVKPIHLKLLYLVNDKILRKLK